MDFVMRISRTSPALVFTSSAVCLLAINAVGCNRSSSNDEPVVQKAPPPEVFTVRIDAGNNGAAPMVQKGYDPSKRRAPRALIFETSGVARLPDEGASQEEWAAVREAAVLDAFAKAIMEARRMAGLPEDEFVEEFSSRMTVAQRISVNGEEFEVRLVDRGMERLFLLRDTVLQHPPHDFELVRKIFAETNGEFTLLPVDEAPMGRMIAKVGCYEKAMLSGHFAENTEDSATPTDFDAADAQTP